MRIRTFAILLLATAIVKADETPKSKLVKEPELRLELLQRVKSDQKARTALIEWMKDRGGIVDKARLTAEEKGEQAKLSHAVEQADKANTEWLGKIIEKHGWPTHSLVGKDGAHAAWLLVQHADAEPMFQRKCLDMMSKAPKDEVAPIDVAYLTDRVLLSEGKKQLYGTQFTSSAGKWEPRPLEDPANVDKRRAEVGLQPLAEYAKMLESLYGGASKK